MNEKPFHQIEFLRNFPTLGRNPVAVEERLNPKIPVAYLITHTRSRMMYVGSTDRPKERRLHHMFHLRKGTHPNRALQAAFDDDSEVEFAFIFANTREEAYEIEQTILDECFDRGILFNLAKNAKHSMAGISHSPETLERMKLRSLGRKLSDDTKLKVGLASKGRNVGLKRSTETRAKISASQLGRKYSPETLARMSIAQRGRNRGAIPAPTRRTMQLAAEGRSKKVLINGNEYFSITDAAKKLGISRSCVKKRIASRSEKFENWMYL